MSCYVRLSQGKRLMWMDSEELREFEKLVSIACRCHLNSVHAHPAISGFMGGHDGPARLLCCAR